MATPEELAKIEEKLGITLPAAYRGVMLDYPFETGSDIYEWDLFGDIEPIIEKTLYYRKHGFFGLPWSKHYLVIGGDGSGNAYYLDQSKDNAIFKISHEDLGVVEKAKSIVEYVELLKLEEAEAKLEEQREAARDLAFAERRKHKKWWQFWL